MSSSPLLALPREIRDIIISYLFTDTPYDTRDTRRVELHINNNHAILRRSFVVPPPSFKGCSKLFRTCKQLHHEGMSFLYQQLEFRVIIDGRRPDFKPTRSRLHSEYPVGELQLCSILRYIRSVSLDLAGFSAKDISRLTTRLRSYLSAIPDISRVKTSRVDLFFDSPLQLNRGYGDDVAEMVREVKSQTVPKVHLAPRGTLARSNWDGFEISQF